MVKFLLTVTILTGIAIVLIIAWSIYKYIRNAKIAEQLLHGSRRGSNFAYNLLKTAFPKSHIFNKIDFIVNPKSPTAAKIPADLVLVDRGGVVVIKVQNMSGSVDNPINDGTWTVTNSKGTTGFANPFVVNRPAVKYLESMLNHEGIDNVPIYSIAVFTGKKVAFKNKMNQLLTAERFISAVKDINRNKFLSSTEVSDSISAVKKHSVPQPVKYRKKSAPVAK